MNEVRLQIVHLTAQVVEDDAAMIKKSAGDMIYLTNNVGDDFTVWNWNDSLTIARAAQTRMLHMAARLDVMITLLESEK